MAKLKKVARGRLRGLEIVKAYGRVAGTRSYGIGIYLPNAGPFQIFGRLGMMLGPDQHHRLDAASDKNARLGALTLKIVTA